ncbi:hypothetical protein X797_010970 [Metarhizium robertsii]|uniref:SCP domain-containing protein n=1 Tax=Metarhizium robertsii TaxID=568076 RepID=A0A014MX57_9HYPO|nr:hypothetical protein X797_010970 [Metarhizium robertsii]
MRTPSSPCQRPPRPTIRLELNSAHGVRRNPSSIPVTAVNNYGNTISSSLIDIPKGTIRSTSALLDPGIEDSLSYGLPPFDIKNTPNGNNEISQPSGPGRISGPSQSCKEGTCGGNNTEYMSFINKWRTIIGKPTLEHDALLEGNACETSRRSPSELEHIIWNRSTGYFWSDLPTMEEACKRFPPGWSGGPTGHADVMSSAKYTKTGCGQKNSIWTCDLACDKPCDFNLHPETQLSRSNSQSNSRRINLGIGNRLGFACAIKTRE